MIIDNSVKNVVFDLGNVIIDIDFQVMFNAFKSIGFDYDETIFEKQEVKDLFTGIEKGKIAPQEFRNEITNATDQKISNDDVDRVFNSILIGYPAERIKLIERLKEKYRLFLLSNTTLIHYHCYSEMLYKEFGYPHLGYLLEKCYYSHELGMRKPEKEIYQHVLNDSGLRPKQTLFIDDMEQNLKPAIELGFQTIQVNREFTIMDIEWNL